MDKVKELALNYVCQTINPNPKLLEKYHRAVRWERFLRYVSFLEIEEHDVIINDEQSMVTIYTNKLGAMDYYPMSDRIMFQNPTRWSYYGFAYIRNNLLDCKSLDAAMKDQDAYDDPILDPDEYLQNLRKTQHLNFEDYEN